MSSQDGFAAAFEVERLKRLKVVGPLNDDCQREVSSIIEDHNRRGVLYSGATGTRLAQAHRHRVERIISNAIELRRASIQLFPELGKDEWLDKFTAELEGTVELEVEKAYAQISARFGGALVQFTDTTFFQPAIETGLKEIARRDIEILRQESKMLASPHAVVSTTPADSRRVFVVHGRNLKARDAMFSFLRALDLSPIEWTEAVSFTGKGSPFIGEVLEQAFSEAAAVVVLITGDDVARLGTRFQDLHDPPHETSLTPQARPNVLFEAGMAFGRHPDRTILVSLGYSRPFSDVAGRNEVRISNRPEHRQALAARLSAAGCAVDTGAKTSWLTEGDFDSALAAPDESVRGAHRRTTKNALELLSLYREPGRTALQGDALIEPYKGMLLEFEGQITQLHSHSNGCTALLWSPPGVNVSATFTDQWKRYLAAFRTGETVTIEGVISSTQDGGKLYLEDCSFPDARVMTDAVSVT